MVAVEYVTLVLNLLMFTAIGYFATGIDCREERASAVGFGFMLLTTLLNIVLIVYRL